MPDMVPIAVVTEARGHGEELTPKHVKTVMVQADSLPEGAFRSLDDLFPTEGDRRYVLRRMEAFEPILAVKVTEPGEDAGLTSRLEQGMRAFAIRVDVTSGVSGFLRPGDRVDVYWTGTAPDRGEITRLIQPNVRLIAVDQIADTERMAPTLARTVTVEATPQQVARLAQAQSTGRLSLSLVGASDLETVLSGDIQIDQEALLDIQAIAPQQVVEAAPVCQTRVRRGAETTIVEIPCPAAN